MPYAKLAKKLIKEFYIPFFLASIWTGYQFFNAKEITVSEMIKNFGPSFFLLSWGVGQFFRVKKQTEVETSLNTIEQRLEKLVINLEHYAEDIIGNITGADGYVSFLVTRKDPTKIGLVLLNNSKYPVFDIGCRLIDMDEPANISAGKLWTDHNFHAANLSSNRVITDCYVFNFADEKCINLNVNVFIGTRTSQIQQCIRVAYHPDGMGMICIGIQTSVNSKIISSTGAEQFPGFEHSDPDAIFRGKYSPEMKKAVEIVC